MNSLLPEKGSGARLNAVPIAVSRLTGWPSLWWRPDFKPQAAQESNIYFYHRLPCERMRYSRRAGSAALDLQTSRVTIRRFLGVQFEPLGYGGGSADRSGKQAERNQHDRRAVPDRQPRDAGELTVNSRALRTGIQGIFRGALKPFPALEYKTRTN